MYQSVDEFSKSVDKGMALLATPCDSPPPDREEDMKSLLAVFITATISMDPEAFNDPELKHKLTAVRMALLKAYNLGVQDAAKKRAELIAAFRLEVVAAYERGYSDGLPPA